MVGILARKGANVMGQDQDDFVLAPLTTIKFRVTGQRQGNQPAAAASSATAAGQPRSQVYPEPAGAALPAAVRQPGGGHAAAGRASPTSTTSGSPPARRRTSRWPSARSPRLLRDRHHIAAGRAGRFQDPRP